MFNPSTLVRLHHRISEMGQQTLYKILTFCHEHQRPLEHLFEMSAADLATHFQLKPTTINALLTSKESDALEILTNLQNKGFRLVTIFDAIYPQQLKNHSAPPALLYVKGDIQLLSVSGIAFHGSRDVSEQGIENAKQLAKQAIKRGFQVVSGHARGVDISAHVSALENGGLTTLVIPEGALQFSMRSELKGLYQKNPQSAIILSEFPPAMPWSATNAMARNKTIIALSKYACIIEASNSGGTWEAGNQALSMGTPLYVVSYKTPPAKATGNMLLIQKGGIPIEDSQLQFPEFDTSPVKKDKPKQLELL
jgi:DNA protecting protein DprA